jgi:hypothetical protein
MDQQVNDDLDGEITHSEELNNDSKHTNELDELNS